MIQDSFIKYGDHFKLLERRGKVCIYQRTCNRQPRGYEVMVILDKPAAFLGGKFIPAGEGLPSASQWGVFGWSYLSCETDRAMTRFETVCKQHNKEPRKVVRRIIRRK